MNERLKADLAVIGGTGLYDLERVEGLREIELDTPFGQLSSPVQCGRFAGRSIAFVARHGSQHSIAPHEINYRANIWAIAQIQPKAVLAVNAVGSMNDRMPPATVVLPDQLIDYTWGRAHSYVGTSQEVSMHIDFTAPYSSDIRQLLIEHGQHIVAAAQATYAATQGPRLETAAEIKRLIADGGDIVGMTGMPEASLAREIGLNYASIAIIANWAAGFKPEHDEITMDDVMLNINSGMSQVVELIELWCNHAD